MNGLWRAQNRNFLGMDWPTLQARIAFFPAWTCVQFPRHWFVGEFFQICWNIQVMAGSGDLQTTRVLRKIRNILPAESTASLNLPKDNSVHGLHISLNMALGILYLGYGKWVEKEENNRKFGSNSCRYCFSNSNLAVAALVLSLFPLFPHSIMDNRFYFQPIRFLWILAVKKSHREKHIKDVSKVQRQEDEERVQCPRCGQIEITKNPKFIFWCLRTPFLVIFIYSYCFSYWPLQISFFFVFWKKMII